MAHGSDRSRFVDMDYGGKRYCVCISALLKFQT